MNDDIPTVDEILDCYNDKCAEQTCENCKLSLGSTSDSTNECAIRYTVAVLTGEMELGDSFRKEEPKPKLPSWCKAGTWVTDSSPSTSLGVINDARSEGRVRVKWLSSNGRRIESYTSTKYLKPVRFRPYTFEEAEKLFSKTIRFTRTSRRRKGSEVVTSVIEGDDGLWINGATFNIWTSYHATIDGIPVGVPEVDKKALKKALKEVNHG